MIVCISEPALLRSGDGRPHSGEEHDILWGLLKNVFGAFLYETGHVGGKKCEKDANCNVR